MPTLEAKTLLTGLVIGESARWHDGRLWFANWGAEEIIAVDLDGNAEVVGQGPARPRLVDRLAARRPPAGDRPRAQPHRARRLDGAARRPRARVGVDDFNEIVVDGRGNVYVNGGVDFHPEEGTAPGIIALVTPGRIGAPGGGGHRVPQRHGRDARQLDADRRRVVRADG